MKLAWALAVWAPIALAWPTRSLVQAVDPALYAAQPMLPFLIVTIFNYAAIWIGWRMLRRRGVTLPMLGFRRGRTLDYVLAAGAALVLILAVYPLASLLVRSLGLDPPAGVAISPDSATDIVGAVLLLGLLIPFAEECLFRGFLIGFLREKMGSPWLVGLIGAAMFAIPHLPRMGAGGALFIFIWATVPIALFLWTRSIFVTAAAHAINNLFAYVIVPLFLVPHP